MHPATDCICMFTPTPEGGHARYSWELLHALTRVAGRSCRFELVTSENLEAEYRTVAYPIHAILPRLKHRREFSGKLSWAMSRILHYPRRERVFLNWLKGRPEVTAVHLQEWTPWLAAPFIRRVRRLGKRVYFTVHNILPHKYPAFVPKAVMRNWIRKGCRACDGLFVHTPRLATQLAEFLGESHPPIQVTPHGIWTVQNAACAPATSERLGWKKLLFFGVIRPNKGLDLLLRAAEFLPGYSITIAGDPYDRAYFDGTIVPLIDRVRAAGVSVDLRAGFTPESEVPAMFASHSAIVLPYTSGFVAQSGVVFLALAHGLPVVASEAGGLRDLMDEYRIGETFSEATPEKLARAVQDLHANARADLLAQQMQAARAYYSWERSARATLAGYAGGFEARKEEHAGCARANPAF